ncbi:MAG: 4a-hydroxytetrahydrobiopterin dehydratase [Gammaproteobacteria bacterium]|nr:4a-hydroxytetrahydrobiopterin dehydratase [Gammaproteobacteria bacterium]
MSDLRLKHCKPCEGGVDPLPESECTRLIAQLHEGWQLRDHGRRLQREFSMPGFNRVLGFVNAVGWVAGIEGHHPDIEFGYGYCRISWTTHAIGGLSENDFICAAKTDALLD